MTLNRSYQQLGFLAVIAIVALRLGVGWHFFKEGAKKFTSEGFSSVGFLQGAKGPFAEAHKAMIPDRFGSSRLNLDQTVAHWANYKKKVESKLGFNAEQSKAAEEILSRYKKRMDTFLKDNRAEINEYFLEVKRFREGQQQKLADVPFQRDRLAAKESELRATAAPWLQGVKQFETQLEDDLHRVADSSQKARGKVHIKDRAVPLVDGVVKYVVIGVGILMIVGLFTRLAALAGIGFLVTVMSTQPPWAAGAATEYFYYQMVEVLAFFVLFAFAAGRFGGLDYVIHSILNRSANDRID